MSKSERMITNFLIVINILIWASIAGVFLYTQHLENSLRVKERIDGNENIITIRREKMEQEDSILNNLAIATETTPTTVETTETESTIATETTPTTVETTETESTIATETTPTTVETTETESTIATETMPTTLETIETESTIATETTPTTLETTETVAAIETDYIQEPKRDYNIQKIGNVDSKYLEEAEQVVSAIPSDIYDVFIEDGFNIYITTENIAQVYCDGQYKSVRAVFRRYAKDIVVEDREAAIWGSIEHEFGHYVDMKSGDISSTNEFYKIYEEEIDQFISGIPDAQCVRDPGEFFAEEYAYSIIDKSKCTPKALEIINRCVAEITTPVE